MESVEGVPHPAKPGAACKRDGAIVRERPAGAGSLFGRARGRRGRELPRRTSSRKGFPLHKGHEYEIEAYYDNTTGHDVDAMAMMALFHHPVDEN